MWVALDPAEAWCRCDARALVRGGAGTIVYIFITAWLYGLYCAGCRGVS